MRHFILIFGLYSLSGCFYTDSHINGRAHGIDSAVVEISGHDKLWDANIVAGKFKINPKIEKADFYKLRILLNGHDRPIEHGIYLDEGRYDITIDSSNLKSYPKVVTDVKIQNELNKYYKEKSLKDKQHLKVFIKSHPSSLVSAYFLDQETRGILENPKHYDTLYTMLDSEVKKSDYAKNAKHRIEGSLRTMIGAEMPDLKGQTPDGTSFNKNILKGKLTVIAFWASWYRPGIHDFYLLKTLYNDLHIKGLEIVGVAIDKHEDRWKKAIADNQLNWLHVSDFKGAYSENFEIYNTNKLPTYIIVGPDLRIVDFDVPVESIRLYFNDFLRQSSIE
jgi:peroxiredoxin